MIAAVWWLGVLGWAVEPDELVGDEAPPEPLPLTRPAEAEVTVVDPGRGRRRRLAWGADPGAALEVQLARSTEVVFAGDGGEDERIGRELVVGATLAPGAPPTLTVREVEATGRDLLSVIELEDGARFWSEHPWALGVQRVDVGVAPPTLGAEELASAALETLQLAWVWLPDDPVGRGARWEVRVGDDDAVVFACTLSQLGRQGATIDVALREGLADGQDVDVAVRGRVWWRPGVPIPVGARFTLELDLGAEGGSARGREEITLTTR